MPLIFVYGGEGLMFKMMILLGMLIMAGVAFLLAALELYKDEVDRR